MSTDRSDGTDRSEAAEVAVADLPAVTGDAAQVPPDEGAPTRAWTTIRVVAAREVSVKLRDKAFLWTTALMLLLVTAATVLPVLLSQRVPSIRVAVQGDAATEVVELAAQLGAQAQDEPASISPLELLYLGGMPAASISWVMVEPGVDIERLLDQEDVAAALLGDEVDELRLVGLRDVPAELETLVTAAAGEIEVAQAAQAGGLSPEQVRSITQPTPPRVELLEPRAEGTMPPEALALMFAFLFYLSVLTFGTSIAQSVVEEKQSRVVELLVAAVPIRWLLTGKVLGNTVMAVGQVLVIVGAGLLGATAAGQGALVSQVAGSAGWFVLFFLLGFVMLSCLWAVGGSLASRVEELSSTTALMQILVIVPFFAAILPIEEGTRTLLSYVPFTAPLLMPARVALGTAEPWEPVVAAVLVLLTAVAFVWVGARLYAGSVLHTSGRLKAAQAWRGTD